MTTNEQQDEVSGERSRGNVTRLTAADRERAVQPLVRAFHDYSLMRYFFPVEQARSRRLTHCFRCLVRHALARGEVYASSLEMDGVALWLPGKRTRLTASSALSSGAAWLPFTAGLGFVRRFLPFYRQIAAWQERWATIPHWYLQLLGVDPAHRRQGHAGRLLANMLARLDREGMACFLDTEDEPNVRFYEGFGFRVLAAGKLPGTEVDCWFMGRVSPIGP